ncbi:MAG: hypothetical protein HQ592_16460 [Planctomycetes bacterium]|nr:hypothetical protein [Planctomycetota bacterium]
MRTLSLGPALMVMFAIAEYGLAASCNNITVRPTKNGSVVYVLGTKKNVIRVLKKK